MSNTVHDRIVPNEEETAAERCSEKLVDLVVLLTTKLDNNVEDLRKELTDNINENIERFEKVQQQQEEEYGKLCLQLQLCNEENDRLNKMLGEVFKLFRKQIIDIFCRQSYQGSQSDHSEIRKPSRYGRD